MYSEFYLAGLLPEVYTYIHDTFSEHPHMHRHRCLDLLFFLTLHPLFFCLSVTGRLLLLAVADTPLDSVHTVPLVPWWDQLSRPLGPERVRDNVDSQPRSRVYSDEERRCSDQSACLVFHGMIASVVCVFLFFSLV